MPFGSHQKSWSGVRNHQHQRKKVTTYLKRTSTALLLPEVLDSCSIQIVYNSHGETRCRHAEIKQHKIQGVTQDHNRTVTKQLMIICQINNIENKCYRSSEGVIPLG